VRLDLSADEARAIAEEAYVVAFPAVLAYWRFWSTTQDPLSSRLTRLDRLTPRRSPAHASPAAPPGPDGPLPDPGRVTSNGWWDLGPEPLVLSTPAVPPGRYHSVRLADPGGRTFAVMGRRSTGDAPTTLLVVSPQWDGFRPVSIDLVQRAPADLVEATVQLSVDGPYDVPAANAVQDGYQVTPLSRWRGQPAPPPAGPRTWPPVDAGTLAGSPRILELFASWAPLGAVDEVQQHHLDRLGELGLRPGVTKWPEGLGPAVAPAVKEGAAAAHRRIAAAAITGRRRVSGWVPDPRAAGVDALASAAAGLAGLADPPEEVMTFLARVDAADTPLNPAQSDYRLTLTEPVPAHHSWSLTLYDATTGALASNEIDRYSVGLRSPHLRQSPGGGVTVRLGVEPPDREGLANWLPAPSGPVLAAFRIYQPGLEALDGSWSPPPLERLPKTGGFGRGDDRLRWPSRAG
jgi:hypothetical protein